MTVCAIPGDLPAHEVICELCGERFTSHDPEVWLCPDCEGDTADMALDDQLARRGLIP